MSDALSRGDSLADVLLRSISVGITVQDAAGRLVYVNDAAARICGFESAAEMRDTPPREIIARFDTLDEDGGPFDFARLPGRLVLAGKKPEPVVIGSRPRGDADGKIRWAMIHADAIRDDEGKAILAINLFQDATEAQRQKTATRVLARATGKLAESLDYETTLAGVADIIVPELADGCRIELLEGERRRVVAEVGRALRGDDAVMVPMVAGGRLDGEIWLGSSRRLVDADLELAREIGRRAGTAIGHARAYASAHEAIRARDDFLSVAGHELRTPLATLVLQLESLKRTVGAGTLSPLRAERRVGEMLEQSNRLSRLVDDLLDVTRISAGRLTLDVESVDLAELVRAVGCRFANEAAREGTSLVVSAGAPCVGLVDRGRVDQVISNLVANALKYGGGNLVEVTCVCEERRAVIRVVDRGSGIAPEDVDRIFDRFERARAPKGKPGLGLGLWIAREIVRAHAGSIDATSSLGVGSTFTVTLPLTLAEA